MNRLRDVSSLSDLLERRAAETPDRVAYLYLGSPTGPVSCTDAALLARAQAIAHRLRAHGERGQRVLLLYPPGLDFIEAFLGCAWAGAIAVPAPPPNPLKPERSLARLVSIVDNAQPTVALTTADMLAAMGEAVARSTTFSRIAWLSTDGLTAPGPVPRVVTTKEDVALLQYTSGSTATPKGVALSHGNLLHNVASFDLGWDHTPDSVLVNWLPAFHDLGLVYGILAPLWGGFRSIQMSPIDVIQRPQLWLEAITQHRGTHSTGPNFIYELCARKVTDADRDRLDLSSWKMALTAAEPVRAETMARFTERFAGVGFRSTAFCPGFGLSEGTCKVVAVTAQEPWTVLHVRDDRLEQHQVELCLPGPHSRAAVACGRPTGGVGVEIVDPETRLRCPPGSVGEIWVSGPSVAQSYWEQPEATEAQLRAHLADGGPTPHLRTGDLGFLHDGQLYITGRLKDLIIVRGSNHYPQDLEYTAQDACPAVRPGCVAAFSYETDGDERVAVVAELDRQSSGGTSASLDEVIAQIRMAISENHGLKAHRVELIRAGTIPKTTSGKIQRQACKRALLAGTLEVLR
jgi:acyl-CoA synthetase (AMP-forming)/AMP-acid ligase II